MTLWGDPWTLFIFIYSPFPFPSPPIFRFRRNSNYLSLWHFGGEVLFFRSGGGKKASSGTEGWTKPASWESLSRGWRPWAKGTRSEGRTTSAATSWWVRLQEETLPSSWCSCSLPPSPFYNFHPFPPFALTPVSQPPPFPVSCFRVFPRRWVRGGHTALFLFLPFPGFTWRPSIVSHSAESTTGDCSF